MKAIDGKFINQEIGSQLRFLIDSKNLKPSLGILCVGNDTASFSFIKVKKKFGEMFGFSVNILNLSEEISIEEIKDNLINLQNKNDAVIVQLPLPEKFKDNTESILGVLEKEKDVDDLNSGNFIAPIVLALNKVMEYIEANSLESFNFHDLKFGIVGLGQVVGLPIKEFLENNNYSVSVIKKDEHEKLLECDVVISGVGKPFLIKKEFIKEGSILIDYGCSFATDPRGAVVACGDFDPECLVKAKFYTPVPGCMGPLVVACLFENVLKSVR